MTDRKHEVEMVWNDRVHVDLKKGPGAGKDSVPFKVSCGGKLVAEITVTGGGVLFISDGKSRKFIMGNEIPAALKKCGTPWKDC